MGCYIDVELDKLDLLAVIFTYLDNKMKFNRVLIGFTWLPTRTTRQFRAIFQHKRKFDSARCRDVSITASILITKISQRITFEKNTPRAQRCFFPAAMSTLIMKKIVLNQRVPRHTQHMCITGFILSTTVAKVTDKCILQVISRASAVV